MKAFQIKVNGKLLDYRLGHEVNLKDFTKDLESRSYKVEKLWQEKRHVVGILNKNNQKFFVKLSTSKGINKTTENEFTWNNQFNKENPRKNSKFWVPKNIESGEFNKLYFFITDYIEGTMLSDRPNPGSENPDFHKHLDDLIDFTELIQSLKIKNLEPDEQFKNKDHIQRQYIKTKLWLEEIPENVVVKYELKQLFNLSSNNNFKRVPRHGDFTPWHIFILENGNLLLIDGEHALSNAIEYYDIAYMIQRIYSVLETKEFALEIINKLKDRNYDLEKLKSVLARRAIGGFLDKSLHKNPNYKLDDEFRNFVLDF